MTKAEHKKLSKKCPWYFHNGQPRCRAIFKLGLHCQLKNCAPAYFLGNLKCSVKSVNED